MIDVMAKVMEVMDIVIGSRCNKMRDVMAMVMELVIGLKL